MFIPAWVCLPSSTGPLLKPGRQSVGLFGHRSFSRAHPSSRSRSCRRGTFSPLCSSLFFLFLLHWKLQTSHTHPQGAMGVATCSSSSFPSLPKPCRGGFLGHQDIGAALPAQLLAPGYRDPSILIKFQRGRRSLWSLLLSLLQLSALCWLNSRVFLAFFFFFQAQSQGPGACLIKQPQHRLLT